MTSSKGRLKAYDQARRTRVVPTIETSVKIRFQRLKSEAVFVRVQASSESQIKSNAHRSGVQIISLGMVYSDMPTLPDRDVLNKSLPNLN